MAHRLRKRQGGEGETDLFALRFPARSGGLTLLELLITVVIVGILAAVALPSFSKAVEKAKVKDAQTALAAIASAERVYRLDQGGFGNLANLTANNYTSDPDSNNQNANWNFAVAGAGAAFTATATRTGGGYNGNTIIADEAYTGNAVYGGKIYNGNHPLRD